MKQKESDQQTEPYYKRKAGTKMSLVQLKRNAAADKRKNNMMNYVNQYAQDVFLYLPQSQQRRIINHRRQRPTQSMFELMRSESERRNVPRVLLPRMEIADRRQQIFRNVITQDMNVDTRKRSLDELLYHNQDQYYDQQDKGKYQPRKVRVVSLEQKGDSYIYQQTSETRQRLLQIEKQLQLRSHQYQFQKAIVSKQKEDIYERQATIAMMQDMLLQKSQELHELQSAMNRKWQQKLEKEQQLWLSQSNTEKQALKLQRSKHRQQYSNMQENRNQLAGTLQGLENQLKDAQNQINSIKRRVQISSNNQVQQTRTLNQYVNDVRRLQATLQEKQALLSNASRLNQQLQKQITRTHNQSYVAVSSAINRANQIHQELANQSLMLHKYKEKQKQLQLVISNYKPEIARLEKQQAQLHQQKLKQQAIGIHNKYSQMLAEHKQQSRAMIMKSQQMRTNLQLALNDLENHKSLVNQLSAERQKLYQRQNTLENKIISLQETKLDNQATKSAFEKALGQSQAAVAASRSTISGMTTQSLHLSRVIQQKELMYDHALAKLSQKDKLYERALHQLNQHTRQLALKDAQLLQAFNDNTQKLADNDRKYAAQFKLFKQNKQLLALKDKKHQQELATVAKISQQKDINISGLKDTLLKQQHNVKALAQKVANLQKEVQISLQREILLQSMLLVAQTVQRQVQKIVERIVEVIVEVPKEVIVYKDREVQKIVQRQVYLDTVINNQVPKPFIIYVPYEEIVTKQAESRIKMVDSIIQTQLQHLPLQQRRLVTQILQQQPLDIGIQTDDWARKLQDQQLSLNMNISNKLAASVSQQVLNYIIQKVIQLSDIKSGGKLDLEASSQIQINQKQGKLWIGQRIISSLGSYYTKHCIWVPSTRAENIVAAYRLLENKPYTEDGHFVYVEGTNCIMIKDIYKNVDFYGLRMINKYQGRNQLSKNGFSLKQIQMKLLIKQLVKFIDRPQ